MNADKANIALENEEHPVIDLFPALNKNCKLEYDDSENKDTKCRIGVTQMSNFGKMIDEDITFENFGDLL